MKLNMKLPQWVEMRMSNVRSSPKIFLIVLIAHAFFIAGSILLFIYSFEARTPIQLQQSQLNKILLCFIAGYCGVFIMWISAIRDGAIYHGNANDVPAYLTERLYGFFPYLFTFGKSNSSNNRHQIGKMWHVYQDNDVREKKLSEIFCLHVNLRGIPILLLIAVLLPSLIFDHVTPSFLKFIYSSSSLFSIYIIFLMFVWLSAIALVLLRVLLWVKSKLTV